MNIKKMSIVTNDGKRKYSACDKHGSTDKQNTGICSVCGAKTITYKEDKVIEDFNIAIFSNEEVEKAIKEFSWFKQHKGKLWEMAINFSRTNLSDFIYLYFGEWEECGPILYFEGFKGTNKNVTDKLKKLFSMLEYHDTFRQCGITLNEFNDVVIIDRFDY